MLEINWVPSARFKEEIYFTFKSVILFLAVAPIPQIWFVLGVMASSSPLGLGIFIPLNSYS
jgi:hypothetical protein